MAWPHYNEARSRSNAKVSPALDVSTFSRPLSEKRYLLLGVVRGRGPALEFDEEFIRITPEPLLTGFERADERMLRRAEVFGRVPTRRIVAAADVSGRFGTSEGGPKSRPFSGTPNSRRHSGQHRGFGLGECNRLAWQRSFA